MRCGNIYPRLKTWDKIINFTNTIMKKIIAVTLIFASFTFAFPWMDISHSDYQYKGPNHTAMYITGPGASNNLALLPFGGASSSATNILIYYIIGATNGVCKFKPKKGLTSAGPLAVLAVDGAPKKIIIDGGKDSKSKLLYVYVDETPAGTIKKILIKGYESVDKIAVSNKNEGVGVTIQNVSKPADGKKIAGNIHTVIVSGKTKKLQSNFGGLGGNSVTDTGAVSIGADSPMGQIKISKKADMSYLLLCGGLVSGGYNYAEAYNECWSSQQVLRTVVNMSSIKKVKIKSIGPAIFGLHVEKKYKDASKLEIKDVVGIENLVDIQ